MSTITPTEPAPTATLMTEAPRKRSSSLKRSQRRLIIGLVAPAVAFMVVVHLLPMIGGVYLSFKNLNVFTFSRLFDAPWAGFDNYQSILFDADNPLRSGFTGAVENTAVYTFWTVTGTLGGGLAVALLMNRPMRGIKVIRTLMLTPWIVPSFVVAVLWQFMWQSDVGVINKLLVDWTGILGERPVWLIGGNSLSISYTGTFLVFLYVWMPYMILPIQAAIERVPTNLLDASADLGATPRQTFWQVIFPLALPGIIAGSIFTFSLTLGDYIIPQIVGNSQFFIGQAVYSHQGTAGNIPLAAAFTVVPIIIMGLYLWLAKRAGAFDAL